MHTRPLSAPVRRALAQIVDAGSTNATDRTKRSLFDRGLVEHVPTTTGTLRLSLTHVGETALSTGILSTDGPTPYDVHNGLIRYEMEELDADETIALFQHLINTRLAWSLQGSYGRTAQHLIRSGHCTMHTQGVA